MRTDVKLRDGYTLADLQRIARIVTVTTSGATTNTVDDEAEAYHGAVEALYSAVEPVTEQALFAAAQDALRRHLRRELAYRGRRTSGARYAAYWDRSSWFTPPVDAQVVIPIAVRQVMAYLPDRHRQVLTVYADANLNRAEAATILGVSPAVAATAIWRARQAFEALWYDHESPPAKSRRTFRKTRQTDGQLAPCGTMAAVQRHLYHKEPLDDACRDARRVHNAPYLAASYQRRKATA